MNQLLIIKRSQAVISFITPNSNNQPWILYESGYADALNDCVLVPVKFAMDISEIAIPLQHKQIYNLSGVEDLHVFLGKLLDLFNIIYDREVFKDIVQAYLKKMRDCWDFTNNAKLESNGYSKMLEKLEQKLEYYLGNVRRDQLLGQVEKYEVILEYRVGKVEKKEYITINQIATVQDVLDEIYYMISEMVLPYKYLESWVLLETKTQKVAIISEDVYGWIPAQSIFKVNSLWKVVYLQKPLIIN